MESVIAIRHAGVADISTIGSLAHQIWPNTYGHLMSEEKLQYMLQLIYNPASLKKQMQEQGHVFLLAEIDNEAAGFASFSKINEQDTYKLHKIYVNTAIQGKGLGKALLNAVIQEIKLLDATTLILNVKKDNTAKTFYEKFGFTIIKEEDIDIGNGFFMNDYVMEKNL
ncbi:MAG: GNAT family N-acetyltransferase [Chitinophagaceae bacterium]